MSDLQFVFVHGLSGWGSYDKAYKKMPYWGMRGGDLMTYLRGQGFACYAASVAPAGSAWDRACELYAQLAGTRTDGACVSRRGMEPLFVMRSTLPAVTSSTTPGVTTTGWSALSPLPFRPVLPPCR